MGNQEKGVRPRAAVAVVGLLALGALAPASAEAQSRGRGGVPPGHLPPPGECRVWRDGVPPGHQPPPTSCSTARREAARWGGRVIYGGADRRGGRWDRDERYDRDERWDRDGRRDRDGRYDRECDAKDRRKGECGWASRYPDSRYPDTRYPDSRYPDRRSLPDIWDIILERNRR